MTAVAFFGYFFLSCGAPIATWVPFIQPSSFLVLTAITAMFSWLTVMLFISAIFRAFVPVDGVRAYAAVIIVSVLVEEAFRLASFKLHTITARVLARLAARGHAKFTAFDEIKLAYSVGWGHGMTHVLFQFLPFLPITWHDATFYNDKCPEMSIFLVSSLSQLGIFYLLSGLHVMFIDGMSRKNYAEVAAVPFVHVAVALLSLLNFNQGGCVASVPLILIAGIAVALAAGGVAWKALTRAPDAADARLRENRI